MEIKILDEVLNLKNGEYKAVIENIIGFKNNNKVLVKFKLEDERIFNKFYHCD